MTTTFTHTPRPACTQSKYAHQRRYGPPNGLGEGHPQLLTHGENTFGVYRDARREVADLEASIGSFARLNLEMTPAEMRELAARLLDAAHDIETNPAAQLMAAIAAEECPA